MRPFAALAAILLAAPSLAADAERGRALAERWCVACHVVAEDAPGGDAGPPLPSVAAAPGSDAAALRRWLSAPHSPMTDVNLSAREIDDIIAWMETLRP